MNCSLKKILTQASFFVVLYFLFTIPKGVYAQTLDPSVWQSSATGLQTQSNPDRKTAGLSFILQVQSWPFLSLSGGVADAGQSYENGQNHLLGPVGIELGQVKIPSVTGAFSSENADWSHNTISFNSDQLKVWMSRLTPALAVQSSAPTLRFFSGNVNGNSFNGTTVTSRTPGPSFPKYVAYSTSGGIQVRPLTQAVISLSSLNQNWLLLWYGNNSHFVDTKKPLNYVGPWTNETAIIPHSDAYLADAPILFTFEHNPVSINQSSEGGVDIAFSSASGYATLMPLFGRDIQLTSVTESWSQSLPANIVQKINWWMSHRCFYPEKATETYAYDAGTDAIRITENVNYLTICSGGVSFAPIPPALALVKDELKVGFTGTVVDANLPTEFGPTLGIENTSSYTWSLTGYKKYTDSTRIFGNNSVPSELDQELTTRVNKLFDANNQPIFFAPWVYIDNVPYGMQRGDVYWANPADTLSHLTDAAEVLTGTPRQQLINYIRAYRAQYPPEDVYNLDFDQGTLRQYFTYMDAGLSNLWHNVQPQAFLTSVPLYSFYSLAGYYQLLNEIPPASVMQKAQNVLNQEMKEQDWASFYWFYNFDKQEVAVANTNRYLAGMVGFVRLAKQSSNSQMEALGRSLLAKAMVLRTGMAKYPRYLYLANLISLPPQVDWQVQYSKIQWIGNIFNYNWSQAYDDARQVVTLDQFGVMLHDHNGFGNESQWNNAYSSAHLVAYQDLVPETARILDDTVKPDAQVYMNKVTAYLPNWYMAFSEAQLGVEHNTSHPVDSFQIFLAKSWLQKDTAQNLAVYLDNPWLETGDLFYMQKLAETIKAYKGVSWSDETGGPSPTPSPTPLPGDVNGDHSVNAVDLRLILTNFIGSTVCSTFNCDVSGDGKVNLLDAAYVIRYFGQTW